MFVPGRPLPEGLKPAVEFLVNSLPMEIMCIQETGTLISLRESLARRKTLSLLEHCERVIEDVRRARPYTLDYLWAHMNYIFSRVSPFEMCIEEFKVANVVLQHIQKICIDNAIAIAKKRDHKILAAIFKLEKIVRSIDGRA